MSLGGAYATARPRDRRRNEGTHSQAVGMPLLSLCLAPELEAGAVLPGTNRQARSPGPTEKPLVMIWADPGCSVLPLTTGNWSITIQTGRTTMGIWLTERDQRLVAGAEAASAATPVPTQIVSNGEYLPPSQSATQKKVEARINELADLNAKRLGLNRRQFMRTSCGGAVGTFPRMRAGIEAAGPAPRIFPGPAVSATESGTEICDAEEAYDFSGISILIPTTALSVKSDRMILLAP